MVSTETKFKVHELITNRFSPINFHPRAIEPEALRSILVAGRLAPSSYNEQPWRFIVANRSDKALFETLLNFLSPKNAEWAKNAGALILSVAKMKFDHNNSLNRHVLHDVGLAVALMIFQAMSLDIYSHQMGGFSSEKARTSFNIPDDYEPVAVIAFGYLDKELFTEDKLESNASSPKNRLALSEIVFLDSWGKSL